MKILLCRPRGFCAGVVRAIETVEKALKKWGAPIYIKHEIVHNKHVVNSLKEKGAIFVEDLSLVPEKSKIIYSAHGVSPAIKKIAKERDLKEIDATCCLVTKIHKAAKSFSEKGYYIILIGHKKHVEIIGTAGEAPNQTIIVESVEDVEKISLDKDQKMLYLTQTTLSFLDVKKIIQTLKDKYPQIESLPSSSICYATTNRQMALSSIVQKVDLALVVGDPKSSNSNRLKELALTRGVDAYLINSPDDIDEKWFKNTGSIAMTAGASTPESVVKECIEKLKSLGATDVDEITYTNENVIFPLPKELDEIN